MKTAYKITFSFGIAHGINDFIAGYLLALLSVTSTNTTLNTLAFLGYSIIAFGGQLPAGIILDKSQKLKFYSLLSVALMLIAVLTSGYSVLFAIFCSSIASAFIHICGGATCYLYQKDNSTFSGIFTAPGVLGLIAGGILGSMTLPFYYFLFLLLPLTILFFIFKNTNFPKYASDSAPTDTTLIDTHDFFMLLLLLAIAVRSMFWNFLHILCFNNNTWLWGLGISAALGKLVGGYLTYKLNWKRYLLVSMLSAVILLYFSKNNLITFCIGVALLQSAVPITLLLMQNYLQNNPATATALSLGTAIILAGLPTYLDSFRQLQNSNPYLMVISFLLILTNGWLIFTNKDIIKRKS